MTLLLKLVRHLGPPQIVPFLMAVNNKAFFVLKYLNCDQNTQICVEKKD